MTRLRKISHHFTDLFICFALRPPKNTQPNKNIKGNAIHKVGTHNNNKKRKKQQKQGNTQSSQMKKMKRKKGQHTPSDTVSTPFSTSQSLHVVSMLPVAINELEGLKLRHTCHGTATTQLSPWHPTGQWCLKISLVGAATSILFVATNLLLRHKNTHSHLKLPNTLTQTHAHTGPHTNSQFLRCVHAGCGNTCRPRCSTACTSCQRTPWSPYPCNSQCCGWWWHPPHPKQTTTGPSHYSTALSIAHKYAYLTH